MHGTIGVLVVAPLLWRSAHRSRLIALAFAAGVLLDVDHAVAARSLDPAAMERLGRRPDSHSLLFASAIAVLTLVATRRRVVAWGVFAILTAHLLFDAPGGGVRWLFPVQHPESIPWLACPLGTLVLVGISAMVARAPLRWPDSFPNAESEPVRERHRGRRAHLR